MEIISSLENLKLNNTIVTLGKFDGNHKGHRLLFDKAVSLKEDGMKVCIFTFDVHPYTVLRNNTTCSLQANGKDATQGGDTTNINSHNYMITSHEEMDDINVPEGVDYIIKFPFNKETMSMEPDTFVKNILVDKLGVKIVVVGVDFRFGRNRSGNVDTLKSLGKCYGFIVNPLEKLTYKTSDSDEVREISSTLIKQEILKGNMEDVKNMLGRPFSTVGEVLHGKHLGSTIGFPTINQIVPDDKILPPDGVYATKTIVDGKEYISITNVGKRPTFDDGEHRTVETNIFDFDKDLYGKHLEVDFYQFIRPERKFNDINELKDEIAKNKIQVMEYFTSI